MSGWAGLDGLLTEVEVAEVLKATGPRAVAHLRRKGELVGVRVGRSWRYHPDDVNAFVDRARGKVPTP